MGWLSADVLMLGTFALMGLTAAFLGVGWLMVRGAAQKLRAEAKAYQERIKFLEFSAGQQALAAAVRRPLNVSELVPASSSAKASDGTAGFLRKAFRAHVMWHNDCPAILPFRTLLTSDQLDDDARHVMACELYSRAILECAMAAHLDKANPRSDRNVLEQLAASWGEEAAERVQRDVEARGVVFDATTEHHSAPH